MITDSQIRRLKKYCREPIENIKGYKEAVESEEMYDCHHINELTFSREELKKMNMYYNRPASELIIITRYDHRILHHRHDMPSANYGEKNGMYGTTGDKSPGYGRTGNKNPMYGRTGDKHPMYLKRGDKSPRWKGDKATIPTIYNRGLRLYKSGRISEEEFQTFRDMRAEYRRSLRKTK